MTHTQMTLIVLRLFHILSGVFWVGSALLLSRFILPSVRAVGPGSAAFMRELNVQRKLPVVLNLASLFSLVSGTLLFWKMGSLAGEAWEGSPTGLTLSLGGALALTAAIVANVVSRPATKRLMKLGADITAAGGIATEEQGAMAIQLQSRMQLAMNAIAILLVLAAACMAVARYV